ncbi:PrgI family protein [Desulfoscipio geothermicus]|uniref:PrgI family protein n=1 Tax=Desulfoscipio geothermicus DSM 3669 TaxID=1121426 RepID=A0A1I6E1Z1_9FIRM|nr:PrgI family protein [Desulfoscipio geothermicus]SFR11647.1 PrgI family protein [Desulfoscipio geothermicus DSM 3669]
MGSANDTNTDMYLIPRNVVTRYEIFPGFGWFELGAVLAGAVVGAVLFGIVSLFTAAGVRFVTLVIPPAFVFAVTRPGPDGLSFYDLIRRKRRWAGSRRRYLYRRGS